jgi:outer membrane protein OmpA-like peptidoglycan-associated protein
VKTLDVLGSALASHELTGYRFRIEGHTDTVGAGDSNKVLSERRAESVVGYLVAKFQIPRQSLEPVGMGKDGLLVQTPDQTPEPRNRRVQVVNIGS